MNKVTVSAPGKLMLFGEHAVVHGKPCVVTAVDSRVTVEVFLNREKKIKIRAPQVGITDYKHPCSSYRATVRGSYWSLGRRSLSESERVRFIESAINNFYEKFNLMEGITVETRSDFSPQYGLGSSSAVTVGVVKALSEIFQKKLSKREIFDLAYQAVLDIQGVGSGFDLAAALWGGTLYFEKGARKVEKLEVDHLPLIVCYSGIKAETPTLIRQVEELKRRQPGKVRKIFDQMEEITLQAKSLLCQEKWLAVGQLMNKNQKLLEELGVCSLRLRKLIKAALKAGALGAKLSGAGGGDNIIALCSPANKKRVEGALSQAGGKIIKVKLNAKGVL